MTVFIRLLVVAMGIAGWWWLVPAYIDAFPEAVRQLSNLHNGSANARPADDMPRRHRRDPWQDDPAPKNRRGGGRW
jgi:hypothetical protein